MLRRGSFVVALCVAFWGHAVQGQGENFTSTHRKCFYSLCASAKAGGGRRRWVPSQNLVKHPLKFFARCWKIIC